MAEYILEMNHIVKEFSGVRALDDVNFKVRQGEIMAICGENGAGKSTLMNVLSGVYPYGEYSGDTVSYTHLIWPAATLISSFFLAILLSSIALFLFEFILCSQQGVLIGPTAALIR